MAVGDTGIRTKTGLQTLIEVARRIFGMRSSLLWCSLSIETLPKHCRIVLCCPDCRNICLKMIASQLGCWRFWSRSTSPCHQWHHRWHRKRGLQQRYSHPEHKTVRSSSSHLFCLLHTYLHAALIVCMRVSAGSFWNFCTSTRRSWIISPYRERNLSKSCRIVFSSARYFPVCTMPSTVRKDRRRSSSQ
jgi:hypothetical protein